MLTATFENEIQSNTESSYTISFTGAVHSIIPKVKQGISPTLSASRKFCKMCGLKLKNSHLNAKNKRFSCKFCNDAVCKKCSNIRCFHADTGTMERICHACFAEAVEEKIRENRKEEAEKLFNLAEEETRINRSEVNRITELLEKIKEILNNKKHDLIQYNREIEKLMGSLKENSDDYIIDPYEITEAEKNISEKNSELDCLKNDLLIKDQEINDLNNEIVKNELKISDLIAEYELLKNSKIESAINKRQKEAQNMNILKSQIISHSGVVSTLKHDIQGLKKKIADSNKDSDCSIQ